MLNAYVELKLLNTSLFCFLTFPRHVNNIDNRLEVNSVIFET